MNPQYELSLVDSLGGKSMRVNYELHLPKTEKNYKNIIFTIYKHTYIRA